MSVARDLLTRSGVNGQRLIGVRHLRSEGRRIPVLLFRNGPSSVAARCLIRPGDTPILDGRSPEEVLALLAGVIDDLLLARGASGVPSIQGDAGRAARAVRRAAGAGADGPPPRR